MSSFTGGQNQCDVGFGLKALPAFACCVKCGRAVFASRETGGWRHFVGWQVGGGRHLTHTHTAGGESFFELD